MRTGGVPWSALRDIAYTQGCRPEGVQIGTSPFSVGVEVSAVSILVWSGVECLDFGMCRVLSQFIAQGGLGGHRQNHDWIVPPMVHSIAVLHS